MSVLRKSNGFYYSKFSIQGHVVHRKLTTKDLNEAKKLEAKLKADLFKNIELGNTFAPENISLNELIVAINAYLKMNSSNILQGA